MSDTPAGPVLTPRKSALLRLQIRDLLHTKAKNDLLLGKLLWTCGGTVEVGGVRTSLAKVWGYTSWYDLVDKELHLQRRKAEYYRAVWETFGVRLAGAWDAQDVVCHSKMRLLARLGPSLTKKNVTTWLHKAARLNVVSLELIVQTATKRRQGEDVPDVSLVPELYTLTFQVTLEERRTIQRVLNDVAQGQGERNGKLLDTLCGEWDALNKSHKKILRLVA